MFTGLVEGLGVLNRVVPRGSEAVLTIQPPWDLGEVVLGESVAVAGACLTVTGLSAEGFTMDVSAETLGLTTLGRLRAGAKVNLERALKLGQRLGGHLVTGHVDCLGRVKGLRRQGQSTVMTIAIPPEHLGLVVAKGSVAVDGVSLTVNQVDSSGFSLNLIPHTLSLTTLSLVKEGDSVNIETDLIGKYVARLLKPDQDREGGGLSAEDLRRMGY